MSKLFYVSIILDGDLIKEFASNSFGGIKRIITREFKKHGKRFYVDIKDNREGHEYCPNIASYSIDELPLGRFVSFKDTKNTCCNIDGTYKL